MNYYVLIPFVTKKAAEEACRTIMEKTGLFSLVIREKIKTENNMEK